MLPFMRQHYGNASSRHELGTRAREAVNVAREQVAALVGVQPSQVVFTSGGTEANNLFIKGAAGYLEPSQIAVSAVEHPCVAKPTPGPRASRLEGSEARRHAGGPDRPRRRRSGAEGTDWHRLGEVSPTRRRELVPARAGNRRTGPQGASLGAHGRGPGARQDRSRLLRSECSCDRHCRPTRIYGPKGAGALVVDKRIELRPLIAGGGHEQGMRSGTENVPAIVGFGAAAELTAARESSLPIASRGCGRSSNRRCIPSARLFSARRRLAFRTRPISLSVISTVRHWWSSSDKLGFAVAAGAACSSASTEPSATLIAMGVERELARGAVRLSLGAGNTEQDVERFVQALKGLVKRLTSLTAMAV